METTDAKEALEAEIRAKYGVAVGHVYLDNDKRMTGRRIKVLGVTLKPGKASCSNSDIHGRCFGPTVWISFKRLATKRLFTKVENP